MCVLCLILIPGDQDHHRQFLLEQTRILRRGSKWEAMVSNQASKLSLCLPSLRILLCILPIPSFFSTHHLLPSIPESHASTMQELSKETH